MKMFMKDMADLGINNESGFDEYVSKVMRKGERLAANCPLMRRMQKTADRFLRAACREVHVEDLPEGQRMMWVNVLTKELVRIMKSGRPVPQMEKMADGIIAQVMGEMAQYFRVLNAIEEAMAPQ